MSRPAASSDFTVDVEGLGTFVFGRRTGRDRFRMAAEFHRLTEGLDVGDSEFGLVADAFVTIKALLVDGPAEITSMLDLEAPASMDPDADAMLLRVFFALRQKELSFRPGAREDGKAARPGDGRDDRVLVPQEVQPSAE